MPLPPLQMAAMMTESIVSNGDNHVLLEGLCSEEETKKVQEVVDDRDPFTSDVDDEENEDNEVTINDEQLNAAEDGDISAED